MAKPCICAHCGSHHEPKNARKPMSNLGKGKDNPFATRGRDEFSTLVAKMEERKQRILKRSGTDDALMVRFVNSNGNKLKPVIIRAKSDIGQMNNTKGVISSEEFTAEETAQEKNTTVQGVKPRKKLKLQQSHICYFAAAVILALFLLVCFKKLWNNPGNVASIMAWLA